MKALKVTAAALCLFPIWASLQAAPSIENAMLAAHNACRAQVGTPALTWSSKLASRAQEWADQLIAQGTYAPRRDGQYGENLFEVTGASATPAAVVDAWMSEGPSYNPRTNTCRGRCGHYTQVVWRNTKSVGCGVARKDRREVWVCNYDPPGNVVGERPY